MAEKETKGSGIFKRFFGNTEQTSEDLNVVEILDSEKKKAGESEEAVSASEHSEEDAMPNMTLDEMDDVNTKSDDKAQKISEKNAEAPEAESNIEKEAKDFFESHHDESIEEKVNHIHENAMRSYASEYDDTSADSEVEDSETSSEEPEGSESDSDDSNESAASSAKTQSYSMQQLIDALKSGNSASSDEEDDEDDGKKKKKKAPKGLEFTDDEINLGEHDSELYEDVNEYYHDYEYTEKAQDTTLFKSFRKSAVVSCISVILTFIFTALCLWFEVGHGAGLPFANVMRPGRYGRVFSMIVLEMLAVCAFLNLDGLLRGVRKLSLKRPAPESIAFVITVVCALHTIISAALAYESTSLKTFCFAGCGALLVLSVNTFIKSFTRFKAFRVVLSKKPKLSTKALNALAEERTVFDKYLNEDSDILEVVNTESVSDFVKHTYTVPKATNLCNLIMYVVLAVSVIAGLITGFLMQFSVYDAITSGVFVFLFSCPVSFLVATALPYFIASVRAYKLHSSILGEAACDVYENAGVISFDDTEAFSPKATKVTSIKTYNNHRIDKVVVYMAKIFDKLGGPLSSVFSSTLQDASYTTDDVMLVENAVDGLRLTIGEDDVLVGTGNFLRMYGIETPIDAIDETEMRSLTSIIWLACNNSLAAKFYVRYGLNRNFEDMLKKLYDASICSGVKTVDPGVDDQLLGGLLKGKNYLVRVIKRDSKEIGKVEEKLPGAVISTSGVHNFLKTFILADKLRGVYKSNVVLSIISAFIGIVLSFLLVFSGALTGSAALIVFLFQLVWLIPQVVISLLGK